MDSKFLKEVIRSADVPPVAAGDDAAAVAAAVWSIHRRRQLRSLAACACGAMLAGGIVTTVIVRSAATLRSPLAGEVPGVRGKQHQVVIAPTPKTGVVETKAVIARLRAEINLRQRIVEALLQAERIDRLQEQQRQLSTSVAAIDRDPTAKLAASYLVSGDEKREIGLPLASAKADYTRVVKLFPGTVWAERAKTRLAAIER